MVSELEIFEYTNKEKVTGKKERDFFYFSPHIHTVYFGNYQSLFTNWCTNE